MKISVEKVGMENIKKMNKFDTIVCNMMRTITKLYEDYPKTYMAIAVLLVILGMANAAVGLFTITKWIIS